MVERGKSERYDMSLWYSELEKVSNNMMNIEGNPSIGTVAGGGNGRKNKKLKCCIKIT